MSSEVALDLVRRDMTEYSQLSSGLYGSTGEDLEKDPPLKKIHGRLSMAVELHGVLTLAGITPGEREWAQALVDNFSDLRFDATQKIHTKYIQRESCVTE